MHIIFKRAAAVSLLLYGSCKAFCRKGVPSALLAATFCLGLASPCFGHAVFIYAWTEGPRICTESYFSRSSKVRNSQVLMQDANGRTLAEAVTDEDGRACFTAPAAAQELIFVVLAGQGHRARYTLPESDVAEAVTAAGSAPVETADAGPAPAPPAPAPSSGHALGPGAPMLTTTQGQAAVADAPAVAPPGPASLPAGEEVLRRLVREEVQVVLTRELAPLRQALARPPSDGPGFRDVVGGLGWIAGLAGLGAWYASRRNGTDSGSRG